MQLCNIHNVFPGTICCRANTLPFLHNTCHPLSKRLVLRSFNATAAVCSVRGSLPYDYLCHQEVCKRPSLFEHRGHWSTAHHQFHYYLHIVLAQICPSKILQRFSLKILTDPSGLRKKYHNPRKQFICVTSRVTPRRQHQKVPSPYRAEQKNICAFFCCWVVALIRHHSLKMTEEKYTAKLHSTDLLRL